MAKKGNFRVNLNTRLLALKKNFISFIKPYLQAITNILYSRSQYQHLLERHPNKLERLVNKVVGWMYHKYQSIREHLRIFIYNQSLSLGSLIIVWEFLKHSRRLLFWLVVLFLVTLIFHFGFNITNSLLDNKAVGGFSGNLFVGIISLLGIIFAFYAVGFQVSTQQYSSEVTDFINQEEVGNFFFKLLVISGLFSLCLGILQSLTTTALIAPLILSLFLSIISLIGLLIYKDDYITKLKPKSLFQTLYNQSLRCIELVNDLHSPNVKDFRLTRSKNVKSFNLIFNVKASRSILYHLQNRLDLRIRLNNILINDLVRNKSFEDATFGITALGYLFVAYAKSKPYIDPSNANWFPSLQQPVRADDQFLFAIKANYEAQGLGMFYQSKPNLDWVENKLIGQLSSIQNNKELMATPLIANALIHAYETILTGRFEQTELGSEKNIRGLYELQDFNDFEKVLNMFFDLANKIPDSESCRINYINCFGEIKTLIIDGFSLRTFPGKKIEWREKITKAIDKLYSANSYKEITVSLIEMELPRIAHSNLMEAATQLDVEKQVEGRIITPKSWLSKKMLKELEDQERITRSKYLDISINSILNIIENSNGPSLRNNLSLVFLQLFNQLVHDENWELLEDIIKKHERRILAFLAKVPVDEFIALELREPIEYGTYSALVSRRKTAFQFYLRLFFFSQVYLYSKVDKNDTIRLLLTARRPLLLGALAYLISEFDRDFEFVTKVTEYAEGLYPQADFVEVFELANDLKSSFGFSTSFNVGFEEDSRYRGFFRQVINEIQQLPEDSFDDDYDDGFMPPFVKRIKHPSRFIRSMGPRDMFFDMDQCIDGYIEWLKKRKEIKKLVRILNYKPV